MDEIKLNLLQDVIDRLLYLNDKDMDRYVESLNLISSIFEIDMEMDGDVRVYKAKEYEKLF
jgi:hypothetical protein